MSDADRSKWNKIYAQASHEPTPRPYLQELHERGLLGEPGRALDVACGRGGNAIFLAELGWVVDAIDISHVAIHALDALELPQLHAMTHDLEQDLDLEAHYDLVICFHYLDRALGLRLVDLLAPGGLLVSEIHGVSNLEQHSKPSRRFLVEDTRELAALYPGLESVEATEGWIGGRYLCRYCGRRGA